MNGDSERDKLDPQSLDGDETKRRRREATLIVAAGLAVLVFALWEIRRPGASDGAVGNVFSFLLVNLNIVLLLLLIFLVLRNLLKLYMEWRVKLPGSQLRSRLVLAFVAIASFPAAVMLLLSLEFSTNAIDGWFNTEVEEALRGAWQLAQTYYREAGEDSTQHARALAEQVGGEDGAMPSGASDELRQRISRYQSAYGVGTVQVVRADGSEVVTVFSDATPTGVPLGADKELLTLVLAGNDATRVEALGESDVVRGAAPVVTVDGVIEGMVVVDHLVDHSPRLWSDDILASFREYRVLKLNKRPFKNLYVLTMALASLVVIFSATWLGLYLARGITEPLGDVVAATKRVADGDWDVELKEVGGDEIGALVTSFNSMTSELKTSHASLEDRRRYIENIVNHIDAGVLSVDEHGLVSTVNAASTSLLGLSAEALVGKDAAVVLGDSGYPEIGTLLADLERGDVQSGTRLNVDREEEGRTLLVTATSLEGEGGMRSGYVLFFENVSQIVQIQRMEAWREVARRIAHEIKNPLTPIQLSAQRMQRRLADRLDGEAGALLEECTTTIVNEVDSLKQLVNEFSTFARQTSSERRPHDLNSVVEETMPLFRQSRPDLRIVDDLATGLPDVVMDRDSIKRVLVNLLDNAVAATGGGEAASNGKDAAEGDVIVRTRHDAALSRVVLEVSDHGPGIPPEHRARVFEPYFSTKENGTGLGLAIVASVAADHHAYLRLLDEEPHGTRVTIEFPDGGPDSET
jgi:two-component system nitrogen regulation sensor histidine kinase NtrY